MQVGKEQEEICAQMRQESEEGTPQRRNCQQKAKRVSAAQPELIVGVLVVGDGA
jgi:hypothetical protein